MSLELYSKIPGQQVKRDRDLSSVTIQCDPRAVYPNNESSVNNRFREREAGKIAVEDDVCNLNVANLTVNGKLTLNSEIAAEICNIFCPVDFTVQALGNINMIANNDITLSTPGPGTGDILLTTEGAGSGSFINLVSDDVILLQAGSGVLTSSIALDTSANTTTVLEVEVGTVTQATNQTTPVTSNSVSGIITLATGTIVQDTPVAFVLNNTKISTDSLILLSFETAVLPVGALLMTSVSGGPGAGLTRIQVSNVGSVSTGVIAPGKVHFLVLNPL
jgi:hypothetical protein